MSRRSLPRRVGGAAGGSVRAEVGGAVVDVVTCDVGVTEDGVDVGVGVGPDGKCKVVE